MSEISTTTTPRNFRAHVELTAENATPSMRSGRHDSVVEFFAIAGLHADIDEPMTKFEPVAGNEWLSAGLAGAVAYTPMTGEGEFPVTLAVYVEGDVTYYRFRRFDDAARAGRLWAAGLI